MQEIPVHEIKSEQGSRYLWLASNINLININNNVIMSKVKKPGATLISHWEEALVSPVMISQVTVSWDLPQVFI